MSRSYRGRTDVLYLRFNPKRRSNQRPRCVVTGKVVFKAHESAMERAGEIISRPNCNATQFRAYSCKYCQGWHLTSKV